MVLMIIMDNIMGNSNSFKFEGGEYLTTIGAAWFVSYKYFKVIQKQHLNWNSTKYSELSIKSKVNNFNRTGKYHYLWLTKVLEMQQLDKHKNYCGIDSATIKKMAAEILIKILETDL